MSEDEKKPRYATGGLVSKGDVLVPRSREARLIRGEFVCSREFLAQKRASGNPNHLSD